MSDNQAELTELLEDHYGTWEGSVSERALQAVGEKVNEHRAKSTMVGLAVASGFVALAPAQAGAVAPPAPGWVAHIVQRGDTLVALSGHSLVTEGQIMANPANRAALPYTDKPDLLIAGETIYLPDNAAASAVVTAEHVVPATAVAGAVTTTSAAPAPPVTTPPTTTPPAPVMKTEVIFTTAGQTTAGAAVLKPGVIVKDNPDTGYTPWTVDSSVISTSGFSADQLNQILALTGAGPQMAGLGPAFAGLEQGSEGPPINALFAMAFAHEESANGTSRIAMRTANDYGMNAVDSDPDRAWSYPSAAAGTAAWYHLLVSEYLTPGGPYFIEPTDTLRDVFDHYSTAGIGEANTIVTLMNQYIQVAQAHGIFPQQWPGNPVTIQVPVTPAPAPVPAPTPPTTTTPPPAAATTTTAPPQTTHQPLEATTAPSTTSTTEVPVTVTTEAAQAETPTTVINGQQTDAIPQQHYTRHEGLDREGQAG